MGTHVRTIPDRIAAVSVGIVWGRKNYRDPAPEFLAPSELGVVIVDCSGHEAMVERRYLLSGGDLDLAVDHLIDLSLPIVGFNLFTFDWLSLGDRVSVDPLIEHSIDLYSVLYGKVSEIVDAEGVSAFPKRGEYGVLSLTSLVEANLGGAVESPDTDVGFTEALEEAESAAALWHKFLATERVFIAGHAHPLDEHDLDRLCGDKPFFDTPQAWRESIKDRPAPQSYRPRARHPVTSFPQIDQRYP